MKLSGRVALVTGSSRGIGAAIVKALAKEGAHVAVNCIKREDRAKQVLDEITAFGGRGVVLKGDVSREKDVAHMFAELKKNYGHVDILVNNAAGRLIFNPFMDTDWQDFMEEADIITKGAYFCCKAALPGMIERKYGRIINIGGSALAQPFLKVYGYWMAKSSLLAMTRTLALEVGPHGITVNSVLPGLIRTEIHETYGPPETGGKQTPQHWDRVINEKQAIKRMGVPEDIAPAVTFLASEEASFITGAALHISGGMITTPV